MNGYTKCETVQSSMWRGQVMESYSLLQGPSSIWNQLASNPEPLLLNALQGVCACGELDFQPASFSECLSPSCPQMQQHPQMWFCVSPPPVTTYLHWMTKQRNSGEPKSCSSWPALCRRSGLFVLVSWPAVSSFLCGCRIRTVFLPLCNEVR